MFFKPISTVKLTLFRKFSVLASKLESPTSSTSSIFSPRNLSIDKEISGIAESGLIGTYSLNSKSLKYLCKFPGNLETITNVPLIPSSDYVLPQYDFGVFQEEANKFYPSVSLIIDKTRSNADKKRLDVWKQKQISVMGQLAFEKSIKDRMDLGTELHEACYKYLQTPEKQCVNTDDSILPSLSNKAHPYWHSAKPALNRIQALKYNEMKLSHPILCYKGVFDAVAVYNNQIVLLEIKTSDKPKLTLKAAYEYPLQVAAYAGVVNYNSSLNLTITSGLILICYPNERKEATILTMHEKELQFYWRKWLKRLLLFWSYENGI